MAHVFLSHSSKDRAETESVRRRLAARNELFLDHDPDDGIAPGAEWERTLYERLQWADAVVCVVTSNYVASQWCFAEVAIAKAQGRTMLGLNFERDVVHPLLQAYQQLDYATDPADALDRLTARLASIDATGGVAWDPRRPAFPGLRAFDADDRAMFFGREDDVERLVRELQSLAVQRRTRGMVVVGPSGSGKSSVVRAGVLPRLQEQDDWWRLRPFVPGAAPMTALAEELARGRKEVGLAPDLPGMQARVATDLDAIAREILVSAPGDRRRLLVVIDQLDEVFTRAVPADREAFLGVVATAAADHDGAIAVVATLRSEFVTELLQSPGARHLRDQLAALSPLGREHLEDVITKPARKAGMAFDAALVRRLVDDTGSGEALPLLAFTLSRLVEGAKAGDTLDLGRYHAIGGVQGAVASRAEAALADAIAGGAGSEADVLAVLRRFVTLDEAGRRTRRTRRRADFDLKQSAMIDTFVQARLLVSDGSDGGGVIAVAHETLFSAWPRLREAIDAAVDQLKVRRNLEQAAAEWEREGRRAAYEWRGERLRRAQAIASDDGDLRSLEREFIAASAATELAAARREAVMLTDRVIASDIIETDTELALLYLLAAADEYAVTPDVVATMRLALSRHYLLGRVGPLASVVQYATMDPRAELVAVADAGTNPIVRPSTRFQPLPPSGQARITLWRLGDGQPRGDAAIPGRVVHAMRFLDDGASLALKVDKRRVVLGPLPSLSVLEDTALTDSNPWEEIPPEGERPMTVRAPRSSTKLIDCPDARRRLNVHGVEVDVWGPDAADGPAPLPPGGHPLTGSWLATSVQREVLATSPSLRVSCLSGPLRLTDLDSPRTERELPITFATAAAFSGDGRRLALASRLALYVFDLATLEQVNQFGRHSDEEGDTYCGVALNHDGTLLASGSLGGGRSHLWDVAAGQRLRRLGGRVVALSPDGKLAAAVTATALVVLAEGDLVVTSLQQVASHMAFAPDGSALLTVSGDEVREYSLPDGTLAGDLRAPDAVAFTPDGRHLLEWTPDGILQWPDRLPEAVIARARRAVYRELTEDERNRFELHRRELR